MRFLSVVGFVLVIGGCVREDTNPNRLGQVLPGPVTIEQGAISSNALNDKFSKASPAMQACYSKTLREHPNTEGSIDFTLRGEKTGMVTDVTRNTVPDSSLSQCLIQALKSIDFSADSGGAPVFVAKWSLSLKPEIKG